MRLGNLVVTISGSSCPSFFLILAGYWMKTSVFFQAQADALSLLGVSFCLPFPSSIHPVLATLSPLDVPLKARKVLWAPLVLEPTEGNNSPALFVSLNSAEQDK